MITSVNSNLLVKFDRIRDSKRNDMTLYNCKVYSPFFFFLKSNFKVHLEKKIKRKLFVIRIRRPKTKEER